MQSVYSEMVESVGYDSDTGEMTVAFIKGRGVRVREACQEEVALDLANAASVGGMMNSTTSKEDTPSDRSVNSVAFKEMAVKIDHNVGSTPSVARR